MTTELTRISPEMFDVANAYITYGTVEETATQLQVPQHEVVRIIQTPEVKRYLDGVYLDLGYRNRSKLGALMDKIIDAKIADAEETGIYTSKDLLDVLALQHKMRMDEIKAEKEAGKTTQIVDNSTNTQIAQFGEGNYGKLMEKLLAPKGGGK